MNKNETAKKRVAIYVRVSTTDQSVDRQIHELTEWIKRDDQYEITEIFSDEGISGTAKDKPEWSRLMTACKEGQFDTVLVTELSRIGRSLKDLINTVSELKELGIGMVFKNQDINTNTPSGMLFLNMLGCMAEYERELVSERIKSKLAYLKSKGKRIGRPTNLNDTVREQIFFLRSKNIGINKISKQLRVGAGTVLKVLAEAS